MGTKSLKKPLKLHIVEKPSGLNSFFKLPGNPFSKPQLLKNDHPEFNPYFGLERELLDPLNQLGPYQPEVFKRMKTKNLNHSHKSISPEWDQPINTKIEIPSGMDMALTPVRVPAVAGLSPLDAIRVQAEAQLRKSNKNEIKTNGINEIKEGGLDVSWTKELETFNREFNRLEVQIGVDKRKSLAHFRSTASPLPTDEILSVPKVKVEIHNSLMPVSSDRRIYHGSNKENAINMSRNRSSNNLSVMGGTEISGDEMESNPRRPIYQAKSQPMLKPAKRLSPTERPVKHHSPPSNPTNYLSPNDKLMSQAHVLEKPIKYANISDKSLKYGNAIDKSLKYSNTSDKPIKPSTSPDRYLIPPTHLSPKSNATSTNSSMPTTPNTPSLPTPMAMDHYSKELAWERRQRFLLEMKVAEEREKVKALEQQVRYLRSIMRSKEL